MKRFWAILLLCAVAAVGSGALRYAHDMLHAPGAAHAHEHGHHHGHDHPGGHDEPTLPAPLHDESTCVIHALLKLPMLGGGFVPLLVCLGLFVAFLTLLPTTPVRSRRPLLLLDRRGPPARASVQLV